MQRPWGPKNEFVKRFFKWHGKADELGSKASRGLERVVLAWPPGS